MRLHELLVVPAALLGVTLSVGSAHADAGTCPRSFPGNGAPPSGAIAVTVLSADLNSDMEGDDDYIPFYDNRADIYGKVRIEGEGFELPEVGDDDTPEWADDNRFVHQISNVTTLSIPIEIELWDADSGWTGDDNQVDMSPDATRKTLKLYFNPCSMVVTGDVYGRGSGVIEIDNTAGGSTGGRFRIRVEMADGRPLAQNDVAIADFDLIQVLPGRQRLIAGKPAVALVRVGSSAPTTVSGTVRVQVWNGSGTLADTTVPLDPPLGPGEVRNMWLFEDSPLVIPGGSPLQARATVNPIGSYAVAPPCYVINNSSGDRTWGVVGTKAPSVLWARTGLLLDLTALIPEDQAKTLMENGSAYLDAIYPIASHPESMSPFPIIPPVNTVADWLYTVLGAVGIPLDSVKPFAMLFELGGIAYLSGYDRLIGILPKDWFEHIAYSWFDGVKGMALGDGFPRAVMLLGHEVVNGVPGNRFIGPAHEVAHTYGLSANAELKNHWVCDIDWGPLGQTPCGMAGGLDEYNHPVYSKGLPTWGYWVPQPKPVPAALAHLPGRPQCRSHCMMGVPPHHAELDWDQWDADQPWPYTNDGRWIDSTDYEQLTDRLSGLQSFSTWLPQLGARLLGRFTPYAIALPRYVYLSGLISWDDRAYSGPVYITAERRSVDVTDPESVYRARFLSASGALLKEIGVPLDWNSPDHRAQVPITHFGLTTVFPAATRTIELRNAMSGKILYQKPVSARAPEVAVTSAVVAARQLVLKWSSSDLDGDALEHTVLISKDGGANWWPAALAVKGLGTSIDVSVLAPGNYLVRVLASDGARLGGAEVGFNVPVGGMKPPIGHWPGGVVLRP